MNSYLPAVREWTFARTPASRAHRSSLDRSIALGFLFYFDQAIADAGLRQQ